MVPGPRSITPAYGLALSLLLMEILFFGFRKVPFTCAHFPGKVNLTGLAVVYIFGFTTYSGTMAAIEARLEHYPLARCRISRSGGGRRGPDRARSTAGILDGDVLDYEDAGDPPIRTLGITTS